MITIERRAPLDAMRATEQLPGSAFTNESGGHRFVITAVRANEPVVLEGSVSALFIRPDRTGVQLTSSCCGIDDDGHAWAQLPANCYEQTGAFGLVITHIDGNGNRTVIYSAAGVIRAGETAQTVDPANVINVDAIVDIINDMQDAVDDCETATAAASAAAETIDSKIANCYMYDRTLTAQDDVNTLLNIKKVYRWKGTDRPANIPTSYAGTIICLGAGGNYYQLVVNINGSVFARGYISSAWSSWVTLANSADLSTLSASLTELEGDVNDAVTAINSRFDNCYMFDGLLTSENDVNTLLNIKKVYRWKSSDRPANIPTNYAGTIICLGAGGSYFQLVINSSGLVFARGYSSSWGSWVRLADNADLTTLAASLDGLGEKVAKTTEEIAVTSIASITGDVGDTHTLAGVTFTKKGDHEFSITGTSTSNAGKGFNYLLGSSESVSNSRTVMASNISEPGTYTLVFEHSGATLDSYNTLFALTESTYGLRRYLKNGDSFVVDQDPVCLFAYAASTTALGSQELTIKWALYKGEEYIGFPYSDTDTVLTGVDYIARVAAKKGVQSAVVGEYMSWGKANALANARHVMNLRWTPLRTMPKSGGSYEAGVEITGIPYSSVRDSDKAVGSNVSIHTFMTAVHDPNSVLYTRKSNTTNATTYYGTVCSGLCNYAYGIGLNLTNTFLGQCDWFEDVPKQDIQIGDMLAKDGHVAMIRDITKDKYGRITSVTVMEEWAPNTRVRYFSSFAKFAEEMSVYWVRRFKKLNAVTYTPIPYVQCFDEEATEIVYPDVQTDHGDAAVFAAGETVTVNVIDAKDYSIITVKRGSTTVKTVTDIESFDIANVQPGLYTITATGAQHISESTFFVADVNGSFNASTGVVTFSSSNATPALVNVYMIGPSDDLGRLLVLCKPIPLTDADRQAGSINVSEYMDQDYKYAKVTFNTPYGSANWYSETHDRWVPIE